MNANNGRSRWTVFVSRRATTGQQQARWRRQSCRPLTQVSSSLFQTLFQLIKALNKSEWDFEAQLFFNSIQLKVPIPIPIPFSRSTLGRTLGPMPQGQRRRKLFRGTKMGKCSSFWLEKGKKTPPLRTSSDCLRASTLRIDKRQQVAADCTGFSAFSTFSPLSASSASSASLSAADKQNWWRIMHFGVAIVDRQ